MDRTPWWDWLGRLMASEGLSPADLSHLSGVDQSVIGRWRDKGAQPSPDNVRKVANALGQSVRQAAILAGHYTAAELIRAREPAIDPETFDLAVFSDERLRDEIYRRMHPGKRARPRSRQELDDTRTMRPMPAHRSTVVRKSAAEAAGQASA